MAKRLPKPQPNKPPAQPAEPSATERIEDSVNRFFVENRYYIFIGLLAAGAVVGIYFWQKHEKDKKMADASQTLASVRKSPFTDEDFLSDGLEIKRAADHHGQFFTSGIAGEDPDELERIAKRVRRTEFEPWIRYHLANRYYAAGEFDKAIDEYESLLKKLQKKGHLLVAMIEKDLERARAEKEYAASTEAPTAPTAAGPRLSIETTAGTIVVELFAEAAPRTVENFVHLAGSGYFDGMSLYASPDVDFEAGSPQPFAIGAGSPWGKAEGGLGYSLPRENLGASVAEGLLLMDNEGDEASGCRFWIAREKEVEDPGEWSAFLEGRGVPAADRDRAWKLLSLEARFSAAIREGRFDQSVQALFQETQQLRQDLTPGENRAYETLTEWGIQTGLYATFGEKLDGWRLARSRKVDGQYTVFGRVVEGLEVLRRLDDEADFLIRITAAPAEAAEAAPSGD